jgi:hypothetical protein
MIEEFKNGIRMALHACRLASAILDERTEDASVRAELARDMESIVPERRRIWLARNREGGLADSLRVLDEQLKTYRA